MSVPKPCVPADVPQTQTPEEARVATDPYNPRNQPIQGVDTPPTEPAGQPTSPPHYAGHTPTYGPNPTSQGVRGYRDLASDEVDLINSIKALQESVADVWAVVATREGVDLRWANIAKTHLEEGVSALVRSIAQPQDPFAAALTRRVRQVADARAREAVTRDLEREPARSAQPSTSDQNLPQQSQDHRPDEGSSA